VYGAKGLDMALEKGDERWKSFGLFLVEASPYTIDECSGGH